MQCNCLQVNAGYSLDYYYYIAEKVEIFIMIKTRDIYTFDVFTYLTSIEFLPDEEVTLKYALKTVIIKRFE